MNLELVEAYHQTTYFADTPRGRLALRISQGDTQLDLLLADFDSETWGFLTAYNPKSVPLSNEENRRRQAGLEEELRAGGWKCFPGAGVGNQGEWPPEPSVLVLGISLAAAMDIGRAYGQHAIVAGRRGKPAELVFV